MRLRLFAILGFLSLLVVAAPVYATPTCTTTIPVASTGTVAASTILTAGTCVAAGDKIFGDFVATGSITGNGSASFTFNTTPGNVTIGFLGTVAQNTTGTLRYDVTVDPALAQGFLIDDVQADFTLNSNPSSSFATATLTGSTNPLTNPAVAINCTRTVNPSGGNCPDTATFAPVSDLILTQSITTGSTAIVTALTDTISQVQVPEPSSLLLLGSGLIGLGVVGRRRAA